MAGIWGAAALCRLEGPGRWQPAEVEEVLARGATHLLLPMVRRPDEVEALLEQVAGRAAVGILVETVAAVEMAAALARLPIFGAFVGLNDLAIERRTRSLFAGLADGTVERVREAFAGKNFGFGGVTAIDRGEPLPARLLVAEMARLGATFSFLRRSFRRDLVGRDAGVEVGRVRSAWEELRARGAAEVEKDRRALQARLAELVLMRGRALVTGAAGFVGCHVVRALVADGWQVCGLVRPGGPGWRRAALPPEVDLEELDLGADGAAVERLVAGLAPRLVVNAAARSAYPERDLVAGVRDDLLGLAHLLAALPASGCRLVALGSSLELQPTPGEAGQRRAARPRQHPRRLARGRHPAGPRRSAGAENRSRGAAALHHLRPVGGGAPPGSQGDRRGLLPASRCR